MPTDLIGPVRRLLMPTNTAYVLPEQPDLQIRVANADAGMVIVSNQKRPGVWMAVVYGVYGSHAAELGRSSPCGDRETAEREAWREGCGSMEMTGEAGRLARLAPLGV